MNAIVLLSTRKPPTPAGNDRMTFDLPANDHSALGAIRGPELDIVVSFVGLSEAEQQRALASFPGARRCVIAAA